MMFLDWLAWWYGTAWARTWAAVFGRANSVLDAFSVGLLSRSLFAPFRQIDAGGVRGPLSIQMRAWFDRTFSRIFGFFIRIIMIFAGLISSAAVVAVGVVWALCWPFVPLLPAVGLLLMLIGWTLR